MAILAHGPNVRADLAVLSTRPHQLAWNLTMAGDYGFLDRVLWGAGHVGE